MRRDRKANPKSRGAQCGRKSPRPPRRTTCVPSATSSIRRTKKRKAPRKVLSIVKGNGYGHRWPASRQNPGKGRLGLVRRHLHQRRHRRSQSRRAQTHPGANEFLPGEETKFAEVRPDSSHSSLRAAKGAGSRRGEALSTQAGFPSTLKIDTGMNRLASPPAMWMLAGRLVKCKHLRLGGVMTHFASSEAFAPSPQGQQTLEQERNFYARSDHLRKLGIDPGIVHMANSAAIAARPESWGDMVRPGVILYGYHPGYDPPEQRTEAERRLPLKR